MSDREADRRLMRLLAAILVAVWAATAIAVATAYRPGGPVDILVAAACFLPVLIADAGVVWPAVGRSPRHRMALVWLWLAALLFAIPVLYGVAASLADGGPQSLVPSYEEAYAAAIALVLMAGFSVLGLLHQRRGVQPLERRATLLSAALALLLSAVVGLAFVFVAVVNDQALRREATASSPFGPTDPDIVPPFCDAPVALGPHARLAIEARSSVDGETRGRARLEGSRSGVDEAWGGSWDGPDGSGALAYRRLGTRAWINLDSADPQAPGRAWQAVRPDPFDLRGGLGLTMDGPPHDLVDVPRGAIVAEDLGLVVVEGARARHCRTFIDGSTALQTFLPLRWLLYGGSQLVDAIPRWRGQLDWWVFADGQLGMADIEVSGTRTETAWAAGGVRAALTARLQATEREQPVDVAAPLALPSASPAAPSAPPASPTAPPAALESDLP